MTRVVKRNGISAIMTQSLEGEGRVRVKKLRQSRQRVTGLNAFVLAYRLFGFQYFAVRELML